MPIVHFQDLGLIDYKAAWDFQEKLFKFNVDAKIIGRVAASEDKKLTISSTYGEFNY